MNTYKNYIDLLRNILKNFDKREFDDIIKNILSTLFDEYYMNRNDKIYCIDNFRVILDENETYEISNMILKKIGIKNHKNMLKICLSKEKLNVIW